MAGLIAASVLLFAQVQSVEAKSYSDETYEKQSMKALAPASSTSKSYRKKGRGETKPHLSSGGEHGSRRFRGEEQIAHRQNPSSDVLVEKEIMDPSQTHEPIFGESNVSQEKMPYMNADFEKWEMRPFEQNEEALTQQEIELIKAHYENSQNDFSSSFHLIRKNIKE